MSETSAGHCTTFEGGVLRITIDRPERRNSLDPASVVALRETLEQADRDHDVRAIVITGNGSKHFCTGADLARKHGGASGSTGAEPGEAPAAQPAERPPLIDARSTVRDWLALYRTYWELETPVITAINGTVAGAGMALALGADLVVARSGARFNSVWTRGGMSAHAADPFFLPKIMPFHRLMEFALLGEPVHAEDLLRWDAINRVVQPNELEAAANEWANRLASLPTLSMGQTKRLYRRSYVSDMDTAFAEEAAAIVMLSPSHDRKEGMAALVEGRKPTFTGR
jgi:2-(1,2-epoxy-1,2-dihydrophenyl)acetyl-CoA isomerase